MHLIARKFKKLKRFWKPQVNWAPVLSNKDLTGLVFSFVPDESLVDLKRANHRFKWIIEETTRLGIRIFVERWHRGILSRLRNTFWLILRYETKLLLDDNHGKFVEKRRHDDVVPFSVCWTCKAPSTIFQDRESAANFFKSKVPQESTCTACSIDSGSRMVDTGRSIAKVITACDYKRGQLDKKQDSLREAQESWAAEDTYDIKSHWAEMHKSLKDAMDYDPGAESEYASTDSESDG